MNLKQFKYALTLAELGSFAAAADELNISQPSLSQYVKNIEQQLGTVLFDRTGGMLRLTDAGRIYVETGQRILELERRMLGGLNDIAEHKSGAIVVGTSPYRSAAMMPIIAKAFKELYPGMHIVTEEMTTLELEEAAKHGKFDLCITMMPVNERLFDYEKFAEEELVVAVPRSMGMLPSNNLLGRKFPVIDAKTLDNKPFVMIKSGQWMQNALEDLSVDYGITLKKAAVVKSLGAQIEMVRAGVGMALLPCGIERFCSTDEVEYYSFKQELPKRSIVVAWQKDRQLSKVVRDLVDVIKSIKW